MPRTVALIWWIVAIVSATESASAQRSTVLISSSRANEAVKFEVQPIPSGEIEVSVSVVDPAGNRRNLPPVRTKVDPRTGAAEGPVLSSEFAGFYFDIEVREAGTGRSLGGSGGIVG